MGWGATSNCSLPIYPAYICFQAIVAFPYNQLIFVFKISSSIFSGYHSSNLSQQITSGGGSGSGEWSYSKCTLLLKRLFCDFISFDISNFFATHLFQNHRVDRANNIVCPFRQFSSSEFSLLTSPHY